MDNTIFQSLGIKENTSKVYLAGLILGTTTIQELARKSGLKRPTVYLHVDDLVKQGFFEPQWINKKQYYRAVEPSVIEERLKKNLATFQEQLPKLVALRSDAAGKPQVQMFEGSEGLKQIYGGIKEANSVCAWSNVGTAYAPFHDEYMELSEIFKERGITVREIIADTKESRRYARLVSKVSGPTYSVRIATKEGIENDTIVYGNMVALFRLHELNMFVVRIEDKTIADTMRTMFDMAWKTARPFR